MIKVIAEYAVIDNNPFSNGNDFTPALDITLINDTNMNINIHNVKLVSRNKYLPFYIFSKNELSNYTNFTLKGKKNHNFQIERFPDKKYRKYKVIINNEFKSNEI